MRQGLEKMQIEVDEVKGERDRLINQTSDLAAMIEGERQNVANLRERVQSLKHQIMNVTVSTPLIDSN